MGIFSKFEGRVEDGFEGAANKMFNSPISPVQIAKKAEKQMRREKMVGAGKQYAPTLYTVLVNAEDDQRLFGYYPTLAGETETYLSAKAMDEGLVMDGQPLVRFIVDDGLRRGKFDVVAEMVAAPIVVQLREEEMERYGLLQPQNRNNRSQMQTARPQEQRQNYAPIQQEEFDPLGDPNQQYAAPRPQQYQQPFEPPQQQFQQPFDQQPPQYQTPYEQDQYQDQFDQQQNQKPPLPYVPENELDYSIDYGEYTFDSQDFEDYNENGAQPIPTGRSRISEPLDGRGRNSGGFPPADFADNQPYDDGFDPGMGAAAVGAGVAGVPLNAPDARGTYAPNDPYANVPAQAPYQAPREPYQAPAQIPIEAPNTVVFTPGSGNANPVANPAMVRASLMNTTDNRNYDLATSRILLGRESGSDIVVDDINASRSHSELRYEPQGVWVITDLGSTNGTLVNGREISSQVLRDGDYITIGMTNFVFMQS